MSRTVILEPLGNMHDASSLAKHKDVVVMFGFGANSAPSVFKTDEFCQRIRQWLEVNEYNADEDVFVVAGRLTKVAIALGVLCDMYTSVRVLIFDGSRNEYVERTLEGCEDREENEINSA